MRVVPYFTAAIAEWLAWQSAKENLDGYLRWALNSWVKKQADFCIVGKKGVRDNLQIAVGLLNYRQETAKKEILECLLSFTK